MLDFRGQIQLIETRGLPPEAARWAALEGAAPPAGAAARQRWALDLAARGLLRRGARLEWPRPAEIEHLAHALETRGARLVWRETEAFPAGLEERLGARAPAWVWIAGDAARLALPGAALVGSRSTPPRLLNAARTLARALAENGTVVVSGLARGADSAAHRGAVQGRAGTLAMPACGILPGLAAAAALLGPASKSATLLALDRPCAAFHAGLALARNAAIVALAGSVTLVASAPRGGSLHAVGWALAWGLPLFCFEDGARTPGANRALIASGRARALKVADGPQAWLEIMTAPAPRRPRPRPKQMDWPSFVPGPARLPA